MSLVKLSDANLILKAELIIDSLTNNSYFTAPVPDLASVQDALQNFKTAVVQAKEGGKTEALIKNDRRTTLLNLLNSLALYVQLESNGNDVILSSSGFSLYKTPQPVGILPKPESFTVQAGYTGTIKLKLKRIYGAKTYQYEYRKKGETIWLVQTHTKSDLIINQLTSGEAYEFRVAGIGTKVERVYSDIITSFVL